MHEKEQVFPIRDKVDILSPDQALDVLTGKIELTQQQFSYIQDVAINTLLQSGYTEDQIQNWYDFGTI